jgi:predicted lipid-binding transport protein (Tim44 family)
VAPASPGALSQTPAMARPAASGASRWLGPLAGLAAGIGLAALFSHLGLSEGFAGLAMLLLLVVGGIFVVRMLMSRRGAVSAPMQYAGAGTTPPSPIALSPGVAPAWTPAPSSIPSLLPETPALSRFPPGFDAGAFAQQALLQFRKLQAAYDAGDRTALADVLTPGMYAEIDKELSERGEHAPTEVAALDAAVQEAATEGDQHWVSVRFTGLLREDGAVLPKPFDEIWNLVKPVDGTSGWLLAGIRQPT